MFILNRKPIINPEMYKYITEQTLRLQNKWLKNVEERYSNNSPYIRVSDLVKHKDEGPQLPNSVYLIPFVSFISFLAGYNFCKSIS